MFVPLSYNLRNLQVRKMTTLMTSLATALSVLVLVGVLSLVAGLKAALGVTANPNHLLAMRSGSTSELVSLLTRQNFSDILSHKEIARASLEMVTVVGIPVASDEEMNVNLRGMTNTGWAMRPELKTIAGRLFQPGSREIVLGSDIAARCPRAYLGATLYFGDTAWVVTGIVDGGRSAFSSEIFADLNQVSSVYRRPDVLSSVLIEAQPGQRDAVIRALREDRRLSLSVEPEQEYYSRQMSAAAPVQFMGLFAAFVMAIGGAFAAMNTMYNAVARRSPEIAILRLLGFSRIAVLTSFLLESTLIGLAGGLLGCLLSLPLNGMQTAIGSFNTWSEMSFHVHIGFETILIGMAFAVLIGSLGGLFPALSAINSTIWRR